MNYRDKYTVGQKFNFSKKIEDIDVHRFAELSGDKNPIHLDDNFAEKSVFKKRIVHGMLIASYISKILGNDFPGKGAIYLGQNLKFLAPVFIGDEIQIIVELQKIREDKPILVFSTLCFKKGEPTCFLEGEAIMKVSDND